MSQLSSNRYKINEFVIDCQKMTIENGEQSIKLPVKVFEFLKLFLINENQTVEREQAIELIWQGNEGVGKRGYINAMWQIRKAFTDLGADCDEIFTTLPKVGYFLIIKPEAIENSLPKKNLKAVYLMVAIFMVVIINLLFFYFYLADKPSDASPNQTLVELNKQTNFQGVEEQPAISHDGNYLAFSWLQEDKSAKIYIKDLKNLDSALNLVSESQDAEVSPAWSADAQSLAYIRIDKNGECHVRVKHLITNKDRLIDTGCSYKPFLNIIDWSYDGLHLIYPKRINNTVAIFKYNLVNNSVTQMSYPPINSTDVMAIWSHNNKDIALIRQTQQQFKVSLLNEAGEESVLVDNKNSITGLTWDIEQNFIYIAYLHKGHYSIYKVDAQTKEKTQLKSIKGASNLSFNQATNELFLSQHVLNEYIVQHSLIDQRIIRRVSSSSRDMYGEYIAETANIIFTSNRSDSWDLWLKSSTETKNLTNGIGAVATSSVSPDSKSFAVSMIKPGQSQQLFLGTLPEGKIIHLDTGDLTPEFPSWSADSKRIFFSAKINDNSGVYQYELKTAQVTQLTNSNEVHTVEGNNGDLYMTRIQQDGIWKFEQKTQRFTKIIDDLASVDFASFFWENNTLYYVARTKENDFVKKYIEDLDDETIATYPINSIRKYKGISKADYQSFIITLRSTFDADISSIKLN